MLKTILILIGVVLIPFAYVGFRLNHLDIPLDKMYAELFKHYKSNEAFGVFD
jgi:hypothetical protein